MKEIFKLGVVIIALFVADICLEQIVPSSERNLIGDELVAAHGIEIVYYLAIIALLAFYGAVIYLIDKEMKGYNHALIDYLKEKGEVKPNGKTNVA
jgi:hypothetical protein